MKSRSLWPKEHGAYVALAAPLITALALWPSLAGLMLGLCVCAVFLVHEPVLVVLGARGTRAVRELGTRAKRRTALLGVVAGLAGVTWLVLAPSTSRLAVLPSVALAAIVAVLVWRRADKTVVGELAVMLALCSVLVPIGLVGDAAWTDAGIAGGVLIAQLWSQTLMVHAVKSKRRSSAPSVSTLALAVAQLGAGVWVWLSLGRAWLGGMMVASSVLAIVTVLAGVSPKSLRKLGWMFAALDVGIVVALLLRG